MTHFELALVDIVTFRLWRAIVQTENQNPTTERLMHET